MDIEFRNTLAKIGNVINYAVINLDTYSLLVVVSLQVTKFVDFYCDFRRRDR